jgi:hypothetical protein
MSYYRVRNNRGQVAAEVSQTGIAVHDQKLSWQLQRLREQGEFPFARADVGEERAQALDDLIHFLEQSGFTIEAGKV